MLIAKIQIGNASSSHGTGPTANSESRPTRKPVSASQRKSRPVRSAIVDVAIANTPAMRIAHVVSRL